MTSSHSSKLLRVTLLLLAAFVTTGCEHADPVKRRILDGAASVGEGPENERIRRMQAVRVYDTSSEKLIEVSPLSLYLSVFAPMCAAQMAEACGTGTYPTCSWCNSANALCLAESFLAAAKPQAKPITSGSWVIPLQTPAASIPLIDWGLDYAEQAGGRAATLLRDMSNGACATATAATVAANFSRAYDVYREGIALKVQAVLDASDAELSSTSSVALASERSMVQWRLKQGAGALGGTSDKLTLADNGSFCSQGAIGTDARRALAVLRDAAIPPADVLGPVTTADLVNGTTLVAPAGSVRQRLADFHGRLDFLDLAVVPTMEKYYGLSLANFDEARRFLREEIIAFSRTDAKLARRRLPNGSLATIDSYAATAAPPTRLPAAFYGALARSNDTTAFVLPVPYSPNLTANMEAYGGRFDLNSAGEAFFGHARYLHKLTLSLPVSVRDAASAPIAMMLTAGDNLGHVQHQMSANGEFRIDAYNSYSDPSAQRVVLGEAALRCAVQGNVEGAPCKLSSGPGPFGTLDEGEYPVYTQALGVATDPHFGFTYSVPFTGTSAVGATRGWERFYLLRVKPTVGRSTPVPGDYEPIIGFTVTKAKPKAIYTIFRGVDERMAELLEPAREGCARPRLNCDGAEFDERIPLEDELSSDNDGIESSWKHHLNLAKEAASKADLLGADYIASGQSEAERTEVVELRQLQQEQLANSKLERLQAICGTGADTRALLSQLTDSAGNLKATGGACSDSSPCTGGDNLRCIQQRCVLAIPTLMARLASSDPGIQRLTTCLNESSSTPFVSLGDASLCLWRDTANPNRLCRGAKPGQCPFVKPANQSCVAAAVLPTTTEPLTVEETVPLGFFEMREDPGPSSQEQALWTDIVQGALSPQQWPTKGPAIIRANILDPIRLAGVANRLDYEERFDGFAAITFDSVPIYETGSPWSGIKTTTWPCATAASVAQPYAIYPTTALDCSTVDGRAQANRRMLAAVLAARSWGSTSLHTSASLATVQGPHCTGDIISRDNLTHYSGVGVTRSNYSTGSAYATTANPLGGCFGPSSYGINLETAFDPPQAGLSLVLPATGSKSNVALYLLGSAVPPWQLIVGNRSELMPLTVVDYLTGLGLIAGRMGAAPSIDLSQPIVINNVEDMEKAAQWVATLGAAIRAATGKSVFANMPDKVRDALRSESAAGAYPEFGGEMAVALSQARSALLRLRENGPLLANEIQQLSYDIREAKTLLQKAAIKKDVSKIQMLSSLQNHIASCATAVAAIPSIDPVSALSKTGVAALTCANTAAQLDFTRDIGDLVGTDATLDGDLALYNFGAKSSSRSTALQTLSLNLMEAQEDLDAGLATIEHLRREAFTQLSNALYAASEQARSQAGVTRAIGNLHAGKQIRYQAALSNARRMAFLAKRAIEQRLGVRLAEMKDDLPLVEAPQKWEATACTFSGVDYSALAADPSGGPRSLANGFIGDYVDKLESVVESYRLQQNFHEGTDTAVISLRDDLMNVRAECSVQGANLLYDAGQLDRTLGWQREGCLTETDVSGATIAQANCVTATPIANDQPIFTDPSTSAVRGYTIAFGAGASATAAMMQTFDLGVGQYRFSWYTKGSLTTGGARAGQVWGDSGVVTLGEVSPTTAPSGWYRKVQRFKVNKPGKVRVGFKKPSSGTVTVAAPMFEQLPAAAGTDSLGLVPFVNTGTSLEQRQPACEDSDGAVFRSSRWQRSCQKLCDHGFAANCRGEPGQSFCYWQADFNINQRDIQQGRVLNFSGFARGNYNYRIDTVALNFVGTPRNCDQSSSPQACFSGGFLPYSLSHVGPFVVRNHQGEDVPARLFDGSIEHARGLALERYITNPLSEADGGLLGQYTRRELQGRPLDGTFVVRIWEEPGVDFGSIQDVQLVLNYRYWTKFD
jgi:hypothetical protein